MFETAILTDASPNNAVLIAGKPAIIVDFDDERVCIRRFADAGNLFDQCIPSKNLGIFQCSNLRQQSNWVSKSAIMPKENIPISSPVACSPEAVTQSVPLSVSQNRDDLKQFMVAVVGELRTIRDELKHIRSELSDLKLQVNCQNNLIEFQLPVTFPMDKPAHWNLLNAKMSQDDSVKTRFITYLSKVGGRSYAECTINIMRTIVSDNMTEEINWRGTNDKFAIKGSAVTNAVIEAVTQQKYHDCTRQKIEEVIQKWIQKSRRRVAPEIQNVEIIVDDDDDDITDVPL